MAADAPEVFAAEASRLLVAVAAGENGAEHSYRALVYQPLFNVVKLRGRLMASRGSTLIGRSVQVPRVRPADVDTITNDTAVRALDRACATAARFDPSRGDGFTWAVNAAGLVYIDVVRDHYATRRRGESIPVDPSDLSALEAQGHIDPARIAETRAALDDALGRLTPEERFAILARLQAGMTYQEIADYLRGDPARTKEVDTLLQSARRKLKAAEAEWRGE